MAMNLSASGAAFVRRHEGFVDHWYLDPVDIPTIGVGFTWRSTSFREWWGRNRPGEKFGPGAKMTREEADRALMFMFAAEYGKAVNDFLAKTIKAHVFDGTCSPVFNLGPGSLKWKWAAAVKAGDLAGAAALLVNTGTTAKGKKLPGLVKRRKEEARLIQFGDYGLETMAPDTDPLADGMLIRGERGAPVLELQTALAALGFYTGRPDGIFGYGTEAAVLSFQRGNGLKGDGYAGPVTLAAIAARKESPKPAPAPTAPAKPTPPAGGQRPAPGGLSGLGAAIIVAIGALIAAAAAGWDWLVNLFS